MRGGFLWVLTFSMGLLGARVVSADQAGSGNSQSSGAAPQSTTGGNTAPAVKITVIKSIVLPSSEKKTTETTTTKSLTDSQHSPPIPSKPAANGRPQPKTAPAVAVKSRASSPAVSQPQSAQPHASQNTPAAIHQASASAPEGIITVEGFIAGLDLNATPPTIRLVLSFGPGLALTADAASTSVVKENHVATLADLQVRDHVKVSYALKDGAHVIKSIEIKTAPEPASSSLSGTTPAEVSKIQ